MSEESPLTIVYRGHEYVRPASALKRWARDFDKGIEAISPAIQDTLKEYVLAVSQEMRRRHSNTWTPGARLSAGEAKGRMNLRSGNMIQKLLGGVKFERGRGGAAATFSGPSWLSVHEYGAVITPKRAKYLTIPLPAAMDSRGVPFKKSLSEWENTKMVPTKRGNGYLVYQERGNRIIPLYVLVTSVKIPPRLGMGYTIRSMRQPMIEKVFNKVIRGFSNAT